MGRPAFYYAIAFGCLCIALGAGLGWQQTRRSDTALEIARVKQQIEDIETCNARVIKVACALEAPSKPGYCETAIQCPDGGQLHSGCRP